MGSRQVAAGLLLLGAVAACFLPLLGKPDGILVGPQRAGINDVTAHTLAARSYPAVAWARGASMLWNPHGLGGMPWMGNPQSALFYPPHWLLLIFPGAISWLIVAHHLWAGVGVLLLCRRWNLDLLPSVVGGMTFMMAPYLVAHTAEGHSAQVFLVTWTPWALLAYERLRHGQVRGAAWLAVILALCFFCGHVQEAFYLALILSFFVVTDAISMPVATRRRAGLLGMWMLAAAITVGLVAFELIPSYIYKQHSARTSGITIEQASATSLELASARQLIDPFAFGPPEQYSGPGQFYWETVLHFGVVPLILAVAGAIFGWRTYPWRRMTLLALAAVLFAAGDDGGLFSLMHQWVPGVGLFRAPARALFFASFAVSVLAAAGLDRTLKQVARREARAAAACAVVLILAVGAELSRHAQRVLRVAERTRVENPLSHWLADRAGPARILAPQELLTDEETARAGLFKLRRYEPVPLMRSVALINAAVTRGDAEEQLVGFGAVDLSRYHKPILDLAGVRYAVVYGRPEQPPPGWNHAAGFQLPPPFTLRGDPPQTFDVTVLENLSPLPRAFVLGRTRPPAAGTSVIPQLRGLDPRAEVIVSPDVLPQGPRQSFRPATIRRHSSTVWEVEVELEHPGYLVLTEIYFPGWRARVDGRPAPVMPVDHCFLGVPLAAGSKTVELRYFTPGLEIGLWISAVALAALLLLFLRFRLSRYSRAPAAAP